MPSQKTCRAPVVVALPAQIDVTHLDRAYDRLYAAFAAGATVVIADFTATARCDCVSLRHLLTVQHRATAREAQLRLVIPPGGLMHRLAALMDLDQQLPIYSTLSEATAAGALPGVNEPGAPRIIAARTVAMTDIIDLIEASQLHILRWQGWLEELGRRPGAPSPGHLGLAATWGTVAALIDLDMRADDEVCAPAIYDRTRQGRALARQSKQAHAEIS